MTTTPFDPGPLVQVDYEHGDHRWTLVLVRDLRHPPEKVWAALTDPAQLGNWAPFTADRDLSSTGAATLTMIDSENPQDLTARVSRANRPNLLEYTWGADVLRWELTETEHGTQLTLRHTVNDQDWVPKVAAGWHLCLLVAEHLLDGQPITPIRGEDALNYGWEELSEAYAQKLGIDPTPPE
jgi:uncharacterized protein YndB with AHSA1/START domain